MSYRHVIGVIAFISSMRIDWCAIWPSWVTTWPWPDVKFWPFKVILCMIRRAMTRQTRWCQSLFWARPLNERRYRRKSFWSKMTWLFVVSDAKTVDMRRNLWWHPSEKAFKSFLFFIYIFVTAITKIIELIWDTTHEYCAAPHPAGNFLPYRADLGGWW